MTDPAPIFELIYAFRRSKTMFAAVSMGVFDRFETEPGDAAAFPDFDRGAVERLLDACLSLGLLTKDGAVYRNTAVASQYLCRHSPNTMAGYILYSNRALFPMWDRLEDALREGTNRWQATFGFPATALFDHFFSTEQGKREFLSGMHGFGQLSSHKVVTAFDLSRFARLVDLGGGTGHLALAAVDRYSAMTAAVFDLPAAIDFAREFTGGRVDLIPGDFFRDPLPPADLFALGRILHDWTGEKIHRLLGLIHNALPPGGGLLIAETLLDEDKSGPVEAHMQSLNMLVCTEGRERTLSEYTALLEAAGFTDVQGCRTGTPLDVILATRP